MEEKPAMAKVGFSKEVSNPLPHLGTKKQIPLFKPQQKN